MQEDIKKYVIKTTLDDLIHEHSDECFWALNPDLDYSSENFSWLPDESCKNYINVFGNSKTGDSRTYFVNAVTYLQGFREFTKVRDYNLKFSTKFPVFAINYTGKKEQEATTGLPQNAINVNYDVDLMKTIYKCLAATTSKYIWITTTGVDYTDFGFDYYPEPWDEKYTHVFGDTCTKWGRTYLLNRYNFTIPREVVSSPGQLKDLKFHSNTGIKWSQVACVSRLHIYFRNPLEKSGIYSTVYSGSYLETLKLWYKDNSAKISCATHIWITSSVCDYSDFDFSWWPDESKIDQIHVFPSVLGENAQKFGDTFLVPVKALSVLDTLDNLLDFTGAINFVEGISLPRVQHPVIKHTLCTQVDAVKSLVSEKFPYTEFIDSNSCSDNISIYPPNLWKITNCTIDVYTRGGSQVVVPEVATSECSNDFYKWKYINFINPTGNSYPLDIVFISNGEECADENFNRLCDVVSASATKNRIIRISGIKGRVASQHAAANASNTSWYFLVNAKLRVDDNFDWRWQPDRLQTPRHYIFMAKNPVNGLCYGHQAIVANSKVITLKTVESGLDFTMAGPHTVVHILSGIAVYNTSVWTTWRTAFRECIKLYSAADKESLTRLKAWLGNGEGKYAEWSKRGAEDAIRYCQEVNLDKNSLMKSYDWAWIKELYTSKYGNVERTV